jgi:hypothetical protein
MAAKLISAELKKVISGKVSLLATLMKNSVISPRDRSAPSSTEYRRRRGIAPDSGGATCGSADGTHIGHRRFVQQQTGNHKHQIDGVDGDVEAFLGK